tara:strand:+ start:297 stop:464 length:168 start_codon:yes stop_codon:yes gene_type:complete
MPVLSGVRILTSLGRTVIMLDSFIRFVFYKLHQREQMGMVQRREKRQFVLFAKKT